MEDNDPVVIERERVRMVGKLARLGMEDRLRFVGVPEQLVPRRLNEFGEEVPGLQALRDKMRSFLFAGEDPSVGFTPTLPGLVLTGQAGSGKSSFAAAWCRKMLSLKYSVRFITIEEFAKFHTSWIEVSRNAARIDDYTERADEWHEEQWRMQQVYELLVVDDVMRSKVPDFILDELHSTLRKRVGSKGCFTIITANRSMTDLSSYLGDRFGDFLRREMMIEPLPEKLDLETLRGR